MGDHRSAISIVLCFSVAAAATAAQDRALPEFNSFVAHVKDRLQTDSDLQSGYSFNERQVEQKLDSSGRIKQETVKVFEVYPALPGEEAYKRLIEENGKPVPASELAKRDRERQKHVEEYAQRLSTQQTPSDRQKATREYQKAMKERRDAIDDIFNVFDVRMTGRDAMDGHNTIAFVLTPRPNVVPRTDSGKMMHHFKARAWISESEYEIVRVEAEAVDDVSFGLGLLARVHKGATATYLRRKVNGEVWLPAKVTYAGSGRLLLVKTMRLGGMSDFSNYRKFSVETTTTVSAAQ